MNRSHDLASYRIREDSQESMEIGLLRGSPACEAPGSLFGLLRQFGQMTNEQNGKAVFARLFNFVHSTFPALHFNVRLPFSDPEVGHVGTTIGQLENTRLVIPRQSASVENSGAAKLESFAGTKVESTASATRVWMRSVMSLYAKTFGGNRTQFSTSFRILPRFLETSNTSCSMTWVLLFGAFTNRSNQSPALWGKKFFSVFAPPITQAHTLSLSPLKSLFLSFSARCWSLDPACFVSSRLSSPPLRIGPMFAKTAANGTFHFVAPSLSLPQLLQSFATGHGSLSGVRA